MRLWALIVTAVLAFAACNSKEPEAWRMERPTAWYLLVVHDYALYQGLTKQVAKDAEWSAVGVFQTETECSNYYMNGNVPKTAQDFDRFWGCLPNTDPELSRRRIKWQHVPRPAAYRR